MSGIDLKRLAVDIDYWNRLAPDEKATHYCLESGGFEYLTEGDSCDIAKPESGRVAKIAMNEVVELRQRLMQSESQVATLQQELSFEKDRVETLYKWRDSWLSRTQADALVDASNAMSDGFDLRADDAAEESMVVRCQEFLLARAKQLRESVKAQESVQKAQEWLVEQWPPQSGHGMSPHRIQPGIRVTHVPSGLSATCDKHRSQHQNRDECMKQIQARLDAPEG